MAPPSQPGVFASQTPQPAYAGGYMAAATQRMPAVRRERTGMIVFAQILMVLKGILWLLAGLAGAAAGVYLLVRGGSVRDLPGFESYASDYGLSVEAVIGVAAAIVLGVAAVAIVIGIVDLILGITVGRPSNVSRWFTIVVTVIASVIALSGLVNELSRPERLGGAVFFAVWLAINVVILYALAVDPRSRHAFG